MSGFSVSARAEPAGMAPSVQTPLQCFRDTREDCTFSPSWPLLVWGLCTRKGFLHFSPSFIDLTHAREALFIVYHKTSSASSEMSSICQLVLFESGTFSISYMAFGSKHYNFTCWHY